MELNEAGFLARRIHDLADVHRSSVLLVGASTGSTSETELRRQIAIVAAFLRDAGTRVEMRLEHGSGWLDGMRFLLSPGDLVACCAAADVLAARTGLPNRLAEQLRRPIYLIEAPRRVTSRRPNVLRMASPWIASAAIILGFLWLQMRLSQSGAGVETSALLVLSIPLEIALIWLCNAAIG
jgi:hypothetical protein